MKSLILPRKAVCAPDLHKKRRLLLLCVGVVAVGLEAVTPARASERPNVVLIMTDDQGYGDFGHNGNEVMKTPHLDRLAAGSASMSDFYVNPVCSPTRASLMTGRYNYRTRVVDTWRGRSMMEPAEVTIAEVLQKAGYRTGIFGKWHLGDSYPMRPMDQGFDESLVHLGGGIAQPSEPLGNNRRYTDPLLYHNGRKVHTHGYVTDVLVDSTNRFIRQSHANDEPFFIYLSTNAPHAPYHDVPEEWHEYYLERADELAELIVPDMQGDRLEREIDRLARISAMITNIDENVGRVMRQLQELGIEDDTLVIYMNDNGPNTRRYVGPFRGMKTDVYEGGIRSPLWLHWPAKLNAGARSERPAAHIDLMPTILEACGLAVPEDVKPDGRSLLPLLVGETDDAGWPERTITIQTHRGDEPQRYHHFMIRDDRWKLVNNSGFRFEELRDEPRFNLYDVREDPGETNDLAEEHPQIVERLKNAYDAWFDDVSTTRPDNFAPPRIIIGATENPAMLTRQDLRHGTWSGDGPAGYWKLDIAEAGTYDVTLLLDPKDVAETATVSFGDQKMTRIVSPGADVALFRSVRMETGEMELVTELTGNGSQRPAYQVILTRRSD